MRCTKARSDVNSTPTPFLNYLKAYVAYLPSIPLRLRVGGNSMDVSTYIKSQTQFLNITDPNAQKDHIPVDFGPTLLYVLSQVGKDIGGVEYIMGELLDFRVLQLTAGMTQVSVWWSRVTRRSSTWRLQLTKPLATS